MDARDLQRQLQERLDEIGQQSEDVKPLENTKLGDLQKSLESTLEKGLETGGHKAPAPPEHHDIGMTALDFKSLRRKRKSWKEFYDFDATYPQNVQVILKRSFVINENWLYPLIAAYALFPSALTERVPILQVYGKAGTGKSTLGHFACKVHGCKSRTANDTEAALRRILNNSRYLYPKTREYEQNVFLVYEDLDPNVLKQDNELIYRLLKLGYDRSSGFISVCGEQQDSLVEQFIYCPKIISSTHPLFNYDPELNRRSLVIKSLPLDEVESFDKSELISVPNTDWKGFSLECKKYWNTLDNAVAFGEAHDALDPLLNAIPSSSKAVLHDLSAVMVATELMQLSEVVAFWRKYFAYKEEITENQSSSLKRLISNAIVEYEQKSLSNPLMAPNMEVTKLDQQLEAWFQQKVILEKPRARELTEIMNSLGYSLQAISNRGYWRRI